MNRQIIIILNRTVQDAKTKTFDIQKTVVCAEAARSLFNQHLELEAANYLIGHHNSRIDEKSLSKQILNYTNNQ